MPRPDGVNHATVVLVLKDARPVADGRGIDMFVVVPFLGRDHVEPRLGNIWIVGDDLVAFLPGDIHPFVTAGTDFALKTGFQVRDDFFRHIALT